MLKKSLFLVKTSKGYLRDYGKRFIVMEAIKNYFWDKPFTVRELLDILKREGVYLGRKEIDNLQVVLRYLIRNNYIIKYEPAYRGKKKINRFTINGRFKKIVKEYGSFLNPEYPAFKYTQEKYLLAKNKVMV